MQRHHVPLATFPRWEHVPLCGQLQLQGFCVEAASADESSPGSGASIISPSRVLNLSSGSESDSESSRAPANPLPLPEAEAVVQPNPLPLPVAQAEAVVQAAQAAPQCLQFQCYGVGCKKRVKQHPRGVVCQVHHDFISCHASCGSIIHIGCVVQTRSGLTMLPDPDIPWLCAKCTPVSMKLEVGVTSLPANECTPDSNLASVTQFSNVAAAEKGVDFNIAEPPKKNREYKTRTFFESRKALFRHMRMTNWTCISGGARPLTLRVMPRRESQTYNCQTYNWLLHLYVKARRMPGPQIQHCPKNARVYQNRNF
jgi:hypothetical protein